MSPGSSQEGSDLLLELEVGAIATGGGCVGHAPDGRVVFVRHAIPGERVRARITETTTHFLRADAMEVLVASSDRVEPPCPHAGPGRCGGCDYQHIALGEQRRLKADRVQEQLSRLAGVDRSIEVEAVVGDSGGLEWRSHVRLAVDPSGAVGFHRHRSHEIEVIEGCPIATAAVGATGAFSARWPGATALEIETHSSGGRRDALIRVMAPRGTAVQIPGDAGIVVGGKVRRPPGHLSIAVGAHTFRVSPGVFWQAHVGAPATLTNALLEMLDVATGDHIVDLYAGAGLFSAPLAQATGGSGRVLAVERDRRACEDARVNGAGYPTLRVLSARVTPRLIAQQIGRPDVIVLDPARQGAGVEVMRALAEHGSTARVVAYVACDPASFGRDARILLDVGWHLTALRAFDIFPMTEHVELMATFTPPS